MSSPKVCKDCVAECDEAVIEDEFGDIFIRPARPVPNRPTPHPGPRCVTHHRAFKKATSARNHQRRVGDVYGLLPGDYEALYAAQGGRCAIHGCRARGAGARRLAVEHDHKLTGRESVRGLCCAVHNEWLGRAGDDPAVFDSLAEYLRNPPAHGVLTDRVSSPQHGVQPLGDSSC